MIYTILRQNETAKWVCVKITHKVCEVMLWIPVKFKNRIFLKNYLFIQISQIIVLILNVKFTNDDNLGLRRVLRRSTLCKSIKSVECKV